MQRKSCLQSLVPTQKKLSGKIELSIIDSYKKET